MDIERYLDYRKRIHSYVFSMTIFKRHYLHGTLSEELYEMIEVTIASKYGLHRRSVIRHTFNLIHTQKIFISNCQP